MKKIVKPFVDGYGSAMRRIYSYLLKGKTFVADGKTYPYFVHKQFRTGCNERAVEIPVVKELLDAFCGERILEIGNVLSNWFSPAHEIVDKYEKSPLPNVRNIDFLEYDSSIRFPLIVSVSTFEHIGWDESPHNPEKALLAFEKVRQLLLPSGKAVITVPVGYNRFLDQAFRNRDIPMSKILCMKRISIHNYWKETTLDDVLKCEYGRPFQNANGLIVGFLFGKEQSNASAS